MAFKVVRWALLQIFTRNESSGHRRGLPSYFSEPSSLPAMFTATAWHLPQAVQPLAEHRQLLWQTNCRRRRFAHLECAFPGRHSTSKYTSNSTAQATAQDKHTQAACTLMLPVKSLSFHSLFLSLSPTFSHNTWMIKWTTDHRHLSLSQLPVDINKERYSPRTCCSKLVITSTAWCKILSFVWAFSALRCIWHIRPSSLKASLMSRTRILWEKKVIR